MFWYSRVFAPALRSPTPPPAASAERVASSFTHSHSGSKSQTTASRHTLRRTRTEQRQNLATSTTTGRSTCWLRLCESSHSASAILAHKRPPSISSRRTLRRSSYRPTFIRTERRLWQFIPPTNDPTPPCPSHPLCLWGSSRFPSRLHPMLRNKRSGSTRPATRSQDRTVSGCSLKARHPGGIPRVSRPKEVLLRRTATRAWSVD